MDIAPCGFAADVVDGVVVVVVVVVAFRVVMIVAVAVFVCVFLVGPGVIRARTEREVPKRRPPGQNRLTKRLACDPTTGGARPLPEVSKETLFRRTRIRIRMRLGCRFLRFW